MYIKCKRCGKMERIPCNHTLKFDIREFPVCDNCWNQFKSWFYRPKSEAYKYGIAA